MSRSKLLLSRYLRDLLGVAGVGGLSLLVACGTRDTGEACTIVSIEEDCPTAADVEDELIGQTLCTQPIQEVVDVHAFIERRDAYDDTGGTPSDVNASCCYEVTLKSQPGSDCVIGRPLTHEGRPITAALGGSQGWRGDDTPDCAGLPEEARRRLAAHWTEVALLEHASVASFARLALELLAHGAPSVLVERAHHAALDEVRHARAAFAMASAYGGEPTEPGALSLPPGLSAATDLVSLAVAAVEEGCVGETLAAVLAAEQLREATDPAVVAALTRVVDEEAQHAELAWDIVRWAVETGGDEVRAAVRQAFVRAASVPSMALFPEPHPEAPGHGMVDHARLAAAARGALERVVLPAAAAL